METYNILATVTVLWLLASGGPASDAHLLTLLAASLTVAALLVSRVVRRRREKL